MLAPTGPVVDVFLDQVGGFKEQLLDMSALGLGIGVGVLVLTFGWKLATSLATVAADNASPRERGDGGSYESGRYSKGTLN